MKTVLRAASSPGTDSHIPNGVVRLDYTSDVDGLADWGLAWPPERGSAWVVAIHGHGSHGDQLYTRQDIRTVWLPEFRRRGLGILTPNLRDNAWMAPAAVQDLAALLAEVRREFGATQFLFVSGSMGGTSNVIYAALRPQDVAGVIARGTATDLASYHAWCRRRNTGVIREIADAIEVAYGGPPTQVPEVYRAHSAVANAARLTMPVFIAHGASDTLIPVAQSRLLVGALANKPDLAYVEVPDGNHDSPLWVQGPPTPLEWLLGRLGLIST